MRRAMSCLCSLSRARAPCAAFAVLFSLWGCEAGYPPSEIEAAPFNDDVAALRARQKRSADRLGETGPLEARLVGTPEGRVLVASIRAHGGWDSWLALPELSYSRIRIVSPEPTSVTPDAKGGIVGPEGESGQAERQSPQTQEESAQTEGASDGPEAEKARPRRGGAEGDGGSRQVLEVRTSSELPRLICSCEGAEHLPHPASASSPGRALTEELFLMSLPFLLQHPSIVGEYLGVEDAIRAGALFERARYTWSAPTGRVQVTAWFDRSTSLLSRALIARPDGRLSLVVFSRWKLVAGIHFPSQRDFFATTHLYGRWDPERPVARDVIMGLTVTE